MIYGSQFPSLSYVPASRENWWEDVRDLCRAYGLVLDPWQENVLRASLGQRSDETWASSRVGLSVARQSGKTALMEARELAGLLIYNEGLIIHSAHLLPTALEGFQRIKYYFENFDDLRKLVRRIREANGDQMIEMMSGQRLLFKARKGGSGRGFSADLLMLDEAQILTEQAWGAILPTLSARPNPQVWLAGTPPGPDDAGEVFGRLRETAKAGKDSRLCWMEWSADPDANLDDRAAWAAANPGLGIRITTDAIIDERHSMDAETFRRERLGVWNAAGGATRFISAADWMATETETPPPDGVRSIGVAFSQDGSRLSVAGAVKHPTGVHVELIGAYSGSTEQGVAALADWLSDRKETLAEIHICGPDAPVLVTALADRKVPSKQVHQVTTGEYFAACAMLVDSVREGVKSPGAFTHPKAGEGDALDASVAICDRKVRASGAWGWEATTEDGDETPTEAISVALRAAKTTKRRPGRKVRGSVS